LTSNPLLSACAASDEEIICGSGTGESSDPVDPKKINLISQKTISSKDLNLEEGKGKITKGSFASLPLTSVAMNKLKLISRSSLWPKRAEGGI
jgi:hypothetical protein